MKCPNCGMELKTVKKDWRYWESGLNNVILKNLTVHVCKCGEEMPELPSVKRLHLAIGYALVKKPAPLAPEEFRFLRKSLRFSAKDFAERLGINAVTLSHWENGGQKISPPADRFMRTLWLLKHVKPTTVAQSVEEFLKHFTGKSRRAQPISISPAKLKKENESLVALQ